MRRRKWGPLELVDEAPSPGPIRASYLDQGFYGAVCTCGTQIIFGARSPEVGCSDCGRKFAVLQPKVR
jgi:hypothetical protein